jgi:hypothetical protein
MVVSADSVLFLDPSQCYLPGTKQKAGKRIGRCGIKLSLDLCRMCLSFLPVMWLNAHCLFIFFRKYPDQLKPLDGLFGFKSTKSYYNGVRDLYPLY